MKINEIVKTKKHSISFEVFPPKNTADYSKFSKAAIDIALLKPSFVSVTYGAGGGTSEYTLSIAKDIKEKTGTESIAHLTCISSSRTEITKRLDALNAAGVENIMALRGDIPLGMTKDDRQSLDYHYASDLIKDIKNSHYDFCIGAACYPECHPESENQNEDLINLKRKTDLGVNFLTTQMVFDNNLFFRFIDRLQECGIDLPVFPGIMPIVNISQLEKAQKLSGSFIPKDLIEISERFGNDSASMQQAGIEYATKQIVDLFNQGVQNVHVYTMNNIIVANQIMDNVQLMID